MNFINPQQNLVGAVKQLQQMMQGKPIAEPKVTKKTEDKTIFPPSLNSPDFLKAWEGWVQFRKEIRKKLTPSTITLQLKKLSKYPVSRAIGTIEASIQNGWQGLFPDMGGMDKLPPASKADNDLIQWNKNRGWVQQSTLAQLKAHPTFMANMANDKFRAWAIEVNPIVKEMVL